MFYSVICIFPLLLSSNGYEPVPESITKLPVGLHYGDNTCNADRYDEGDTLYVLALGGSRLRGLEGGIIDLIPYGSQIVLLEVPSYKPIPDTLQNIPGYWVTATWKGATGAVFDGFLSRLPAPDLDVEGGGYVGRYFSRIEGSHDKYMFKNYLITFTHEVFEGSEGGEGHGFSSSMTISHGDISTKEMYLLMRALYRQEIDGFLEELKKGAGYYVNELYPQNKDQNYFQFVYGTESMSYQMPSISIGYGRCFHGAYISFDYAD